MSTSSCRRAVSSSCCRPQERSCGQTNGSKSDRSLAHHKTMRAAETQDRKRARFAETTPSLPPKLSPHEFSFLEEPHPYGVLPGGNRFFDDSVKEKDQASHLSPPEIIRDDECWHSVLSFLDAPELARTSSTCRFFYVAGHQPELWRDLVLRRCQAERRSISKVGPSWRDTYVQLFHPNGYGSSPHRPIRVSGVYSDFYYRLHSCRAFAIPEAWLERDLPGPCTVKSILADKLDEKAFKNEFERPNTPLLVRDVAKGWKAFNKWQDRAYCLEQTNGRTFRATSGAAPLPADFSLDAYFAYCRSSHLEEAPLYLFDRTALAPGSQLWSDYMDDLKQKCPYWDPSRVEQNGHDLFQILGEGRRPDHTWLIVGPRRSGSVFHIDPNATHAWNIAMAGRKRWLFYPPGVAPPGVHPSRDGDQVLLPLSIGEWLFQFWEEHTKRKLSSPPHQRPIECTAMPGDAIFVPHGWWHMVVNLDDLNIAVTHNYVADTNLSNVLKFLETKRDQVSGCRDRQESIKPENLFERFKEELQSTHPEYLKKALAESKWTCSAWCDGQEPTSENKQRSEKVSVMEKAKTQTDGFSFSFL